MSRFRKKTSFMQMFGRAEDDLSLLHGSTKVDGSIDDMSGIYGKYTGMNQPARDSLEYCSSDFLGAAASTDKTSMHTHGSRRAQSNNVCEVGGLDDQQPHLESPKVIASDRLHHFDREKYVSPRRGIREKLRGGTLTAAGEHPVSPRKRFLKRSFSEKIMRTIKPLDRSPKGSNVNHIGEIKVNFAAVADSRHNPNQPPEMKAETDSQPKNKTLLKPFAKKSWKLKENSRIDALFTDSLAKKVTATVQTVHSSDLQHSFHQLNLGEMVPEVVCEAVKSRELMDDLKKRSNKHHYMMSDSSSDEESTDVSESLDKIGNRAEEERDHETIDIPRSKSDESKNEDFFACIVVKDVEEETQIAHGAEFPGAFISDNKTNDNIAPSENEIAPFETHMATVRKRNTSEEVDVGRKSRKSKNVQTQNEMRTWERSPSRDRPRRNSTKESASRRTVELAFSPPSSPKIETHLGQCGTKKDTPSNHEKNKPRKSPQSNKSSPLQRNREDASANRKSSDDLRSFSMPDVLSDIASDMRFAEMKAVLDDFERMDISDLLKHPDDHLKDVDLKMSTVPFPSCYIDVKDLDHSANMIMDSIADRFGVGDQADISYRYWRLYEELEQSKARLLLSFQEVSRIEQEVEQLKQRLKGCDEANNLSR